MNERRAQVLVLAEIHATEKSEHGEPDLAVARELGVDTEDYRTYRQVGEAIDRYGLRYEGHEVLQGSPGRAGSEVETAERLIGYALDLHRSWRGSTGWAEHEIDDYARRILATTLTLKAQLEGRQLDLTQPRESDVELGHEL